MVAPIDEYTYRIKYDYDPDTGILEATLYAMKGNETTIIMNNTITDTIKAKEILALLRKMRAR